MQNSIHDLKKMLVLVLLYFLQIPYNFFTRDKAVVEKLWKTEKMLFFSHNLKCDILSNKKNTIRKTYIY